MYRKREWIAIIIISIVFILGSFLYIKLELDIIYKESSSHLYEVYDQINMDFKSLADNNWKMLQDWNDHIQYISKHDGKENIMGYIDDKKSEWKFTDFYFLNSDGKYMTYTGKRGYIDLGSQLDTLMTEKQNVVIDGTLSNGDELAIFAVPVKKNKYKSFIYSAIAISYNDIMKKRLNVNAFSNNVEFYLVYPNGRVIMSNKKEGPNNFLAMIEDKGNVSKEELDIAKNEIKKGHKGTLSYEMNGKGYYMTYMPVGFQNWVLLGSAPKSVVNGSMNNMRWITAIAVAGGFILIFLSWFILYRRIYLMKIQDMDVELQYREQLFELLALNSMDIYAMFSSKDYKVEYISPNIERLLGIPVKDILADITALGQSHMGDIKFGWKDMASLKAGECIVAERERKNAKTGEQRFYRESLYRGSIKGKDKFLLVMMDCTEDKKLRHQLEEAVDIAKAANRAKSNFLSNVSHDIRTPMNAIMGFAELLSKNIGNKDKIEEYSYKISTSSKQLLGLINDVLDMSRIESGKTTLLIKEFSLESLLDEVKTIIQPLVIAKQQQFIITHDNIVRNKYRGDITKIKQILINLLSNAVKYTQEGGCISFSINCVKQKTIGNTCIRFEVKDNGIGMSDEYLTKIFEPFTRETSSGINIEQGTGLGMAITRNLIDLMGGTISVNSQKGKGSIFTVELEFSNVETDYDKNSSIILCKDGIAKKEDGTKQRNKGIEELRFLVAEDNELNAEIINELLVMEGAECDIVSNGKEAVEVFECSENGYYDVILMDIQMPVMLGTDATIAIRSSNHPQAKTIKIIAMTANAFADDIEQSLASGMDAHISKPFDISNVKECVRGLL